MLVVSRSASEGVLFGGGLKIIVGQIDNRVRLPVVNLILATTSGVAFGSGSDAYPIERAHRLGVWDVQAERDNVIRGILEGGQSWFVITIVSICGNTVQLGLDAPDDVPIWRLELLARGAAKKKQAQNT